MRRSALLLLLAGACAEGIGPENQYFGLSQAQVQAVAEVLATGGIGPLLRLVPPSVAPGLVRIPVAAASECPVSGGTSLSGLIQGSAAGGSASLLISVGQTAGRCVFALGGRTYELNPVGALSVGGFANYLDGVLLATQTVFLTGTVQVIGDQSAQAICPVDLTVTITGWISPVRVQGNICGRGIDQTVAV